MAFMREPPVIQSVYDHTVPWTIGSDKIYIFYGVYNSKNFAAMSIYISPLWSSLGFGS